MEKSIIDLDIMKQAEDSEIKLPVKRLRALGIVFFSVIIFAVSMTPVLVQAVAEKDLGAFYQLSCASCHGADGSAYSAEGKKLRGLNLTDPDWQRSTSDEKMVKAILKGKFFGLAMPGFKKTLTGEEIQRMVTDIIRNSKKGELIAPDAKAVKP